jgi:hypothetical protein
LRSSASADDLIQYACHSSAGEAGVHLKHQTLSREGINDAQYADVRPAASTS